MEKKKILIIDDEPHIIKEAFDALVEAGYIISCAHNRQEALKKLKEFKADLILLDLVLPGQSGFKIAQEIKSTEEYKNIPMVVVSSKREAIDKHIAVKSGAVEYIEKPVDKERLLFKIKDILNI